MTTIDVHSHIFPDYYGNALESVGIRDIDGFPKPTWDIGSHIAAMDKNGIRACVLSISSPGVEFIEGTHAAQLARQLNEQTASIITDHGGRFGAFALLPLPDIDRSLAEIAYALDVLKLDGVGLLSNYAGIYAGDPHFASIFDELNRRKAVVFIHPTAPPCIDKLSLGYPAPMIEYPFENTRVAVSLIDSNTLTRCPDLRIIIPHGGGTIPYLEQRIAGLIAMKRRDLKAIPQITQQLHSFFYDLTSTTNHAALAAIRETIPVSRLLMGFDYPFMPEQGLPLAIESFHSYAGFSADEKIAIDHRNAQSLFPRFSLGPVTV